MTAKPLAIHYAGELLYPSGARGVTHILPGYAACCFNRRAEKIRRRGNHTYDRAKVTCGTCKSLIEKASAPRPCSLCRRETDRSAVTVGERLCERCERAVNAGLPPRKCDRKGCERGRIWCKKHNDVLGEDGLCNACGNDDPSERCDACEGRGVVYPKEAVE